jgi:hypothetical protein
MTCHCTLVPLSPAQIAANLYDERDEDTGMLRDLEPFEAEFITAYHKITDHKTDVINAARRVYGDTPKTYRCCLLVADTNCRIELDAALAKYRKAHDRAMEDADV